MKGINFATPTGGYVDLGALAPATMLLDQAQT